MSKPNSEKKIIGLTGGIGSGKSLISSLFASLGIPSYNSDKEAKNLYKLEHIKSQVIELFGKGVYSKDVLNKESLAKIVFSDKQKLEQLNGVIHPEVKIHFENWLNAQDSSIIIKETAILIETKIYKSCDYVISVSSPEEIRIARVLRRDSTSIAQIQNRLSKQISDLERNKFADWIIDNSGKKSVIKQVYKIYTSLL